MFQPLLKWITEVNEMIEMRCVITEVVAGRFTTPGVKLSTDITMR
jgi:hypothetical protein